MRFQSDIIGLTDTLLREFSQSSSNLKTALLWEALNITMNNAQFDIAVMALRMSVDNIEVARLFLVDGNTVEEMQKHYGVSPSRLSKVLKRVSQNYADQLDKLGLVKGEYALDKKTARLVRELESSKINEAKMKAQIAQKEKKSTRRKKK